MQLDADEDGEPFFRPPAINAAPIKPKEDEVSQPAAETGQEAAAVATAEQEE